MLKDMLWKNIKKVLPRLFGTKHFVCVDWKNDGMKIRLDQDKKTYSTRDQGNRGRLGWLWNCHYAGNNMTGSLHFAGHFITGFTIVTWWL